MSVTGFKKALITALLLCLLAGLMSFAAYAHVVNNPWVRSNLDDDFTEDSPFINAEDRFEVAVPFVYDFAWGFVEGFATVVLGENESVIDMNGNEIIPAHFAIISEFNEGMALAHTHSDETYFISSDASVVMPLNYDEANLFFNGLAPVRSGDKWGYIDKEGSQAIPLIYDFAGTFSEGIAAVGYDWQWGFIDTDGVQVIPFMYDEVLDFKDGVTWVKQGENWGLIDKSGNELIEFKYENAQPFSEGLAAVQLRGRWGYIDKEGNEIIPFIYEAAIRFDEGLAPVSTNDKWGFIDFAGRLVVPFEFNQISISSGGLIVVEDNMIFNVIDRHGNALLSGYDMILGFNEGMAPALRDGKWGFIRDTAYVPGRMAQSWEDFSMTAQEAPGAQSNNDSGLLSRLGPFLAGVALTLVVGTMIILPLRRAAAKKSKKK
jgi:hypothetical protein